MSKKEAASSRFSKSARTSPSSRTSRVDPGRWLLERQRFSLPPHARPRPPDRIASIQSLIPSLIEKFNDSTHLHVEALSRLWPKLSGSPIAAHTRLGALKNGLLTVYVDHSIWLSEIQRYHSSTLLKRIQSAYPQGHVRSLSFRLEPDSPPPRSRRRSFPRKRG